MTNLPSLYHGTLMTVRRAWCVCRLTVLLLAAALMERVGAQTTIVPTVASQALALRLARALGSGGFEDYNKALVGPGSPLETPLSRALAGAVSAHVAKFLPRDSLIAMTARQYQVNFTEDQLRELLAFYEGPIGTRFLEVQGRVLVATKADADRVLSLHVADLQRAIEAIVRPPFDRDEI
jgi:hypothetical protein